MKTDASLFYNQVVEALAADAPSYIESQADRELFQALKAGEYCYVLHARQIGKSSVANRIKQRLQQSGSVCVSIDLSNIACHNITTTKLFFGMIESLVNSLELANIFDLSSWWSERKMLPPLLIFERFLEEIVFPQMPDPLIILIENVEAILDLPCSGLFTCARSLYNKRADTPAYRHFTIAFVSAVSLSEVTKGEITPYNIGTFIDATTSNI